MRDRIQDLLQKAADLTLFYWNKVNNAFTDKIRDQVHARNQLQNHLAKVCFTCICFHLQSLDFQL